MKKISLRQLFSKLFIFVAICLLLYPAVSDTYNARHSSYVIEDYQKATDTIGSEDYSDLLEKAKAYNENLVDNPSRYKMTDKEMEEYLSLLDVSGNGVMGSISIPRINVQLPIYHTTEDSVLQVAAGHIPGTSLPIEGESTHVAISGHRGMASVSLFTDLPKLKIGDIFQISVLKKVHTYEVDQILTVLPNEMEALEIVEGKEYCTLITCVPLGINDHRLMVRGHRVETHLADETAAAEKKVPASHRLNTYEVCMACAAAGLFFAKFVFPTIKAKYKKAKRR